MRIKELADTITKNGFTYHLERKTDTGYIYRQTENGETIGFEVFERKVKPYPSFAESEDFTHYVAFPTNEAFGSWAWSWFTLGAAEKTLQKIEKKQPAFILK